MIKIPEKINKPRNKVSTHISPEGTMPYLLFLDKQNETMENKPITQLLFLHPCMYLKVGAYEHGNLHTTKVVPVLTELRQTERLQCAFMLIIK
jgi:hypothetical protein